MTELDKVILAAQSVILAVMAITLLFLIKTASRLTDAIRSMIRSNSAVIGYALRENEESEIKYPPPGKPGN